MINSSRTQQSAGNNALQIAQSPPHIKFNLCNLLNLWIKKMKPDLAAAESGSLSTVL